MIYEITSRDNKTLKDIRALKRKNVRLDARRFIAEGTRLVSEALDFAPESIWCIVMSAFFFEKETALSEYAASICDRIYKVPENVFETLSDTDTPQGIMAVMNMKDDCPNIEDGRYIAVLDGVSEPGNMGTVIRTAEALGFDGIYLMKGCADIYSPKTVRATMGSVFRMKFRSGCTAEDIEDLRNRGFRIVSTTPGGETRLEEYYSKEKQAVIIGNEAHGVSRELLDMSDVRIKITMDGMAESLNAAVAAGIAMHWLKNISAAGFRAPK